MEKVNDEEKDIYDLLIGGIMSIEQLWGNDPKLPGINISKIDKGKKDVEAVREIINKAKESLVTGTAIEKQGIEFIIQSNDRLNRLFNISPDFAYMCAIEIMNRIVFETPSLSTIIITLIEGSNTDGESMTKYIIESNAYLSGLYKESPSNAYAALIKMLAEEIEGDPQRADEYVTLYDWSIHKPRSKKASLIKQELLAKIKNNRII